MTELLISKYDLSGFGVSSFLRHDQKECACLVPGSIVHEVVEAHSMIKVRHPRVRYMAKEISISKPSPLRTLPQCPHFGMCGGCSMQHIQYEEQCGIKEEIVRNLFSPLCVPSCFKSIIPCKNPFHYRSKMEFSFSQDKEGKKFLGLYGDHGHVCSLSVCKLVPSWMSEALSGVKAWWNDSSLQAYYMRKNIGTLETITFREGKGSLDRMVILTVSGNPDYAIKKEDIRDFVEAIEKTISFPHLSIVLRIRQIIKGQPTQIYEMILSGPDYIREEVRLSDRELLLHVSPQSFLQPNREQASLLYEEAIKLLDIQPEEIVYDLYCGIGFFGMLAAKSAKSVIGIEISKDSAYDAKTNKDRLGLSNFSIKQGDVLQVIRAMKQEEGFLPPDSIIVDPPRMGLEKKMKEEIGQLLPKKILYVSCNPHTQHEDVQELLHFGYSIEKVVPIDQFPHTPHIENIILLVRG